MKVAILKFLSDRFGHFSSMRAVFVVVTLTVTFCILTVWTYISIRRIEVADIPMGVVTFAIGVIGTLAGIKTWQKKVESETADTIVLSPVAKTEEKTEEAPKPDEAEG